VIDAQIIAELNGQRRWKMDGKPYNAFAEEMLNYFLKEVSPQRLEEIKNIYREIGHEHKSEFVLQAIDLYISFYKKKKEKRADLVSGVVIKFRGTLERLIQKVGEENILILKAKGLGYSGNGKTENNPKSDISKPF